jgi:hypothetical protein
MMNEKPRIHIRTVRCQNDLILDVVHLHLQYYRTLVLYVTFHIIAELLR